MNTEQLFSSFFGGVENTPDWLPRPVILVSPEEYLNMSPERMANVRSARFVPPRIGGPGFGCFELILKTPELFAHVLN